MPDPARPGADRSKSFTASGWQEAERIHRERLGQSDTNELPDNSKLTLDELAERRWEILEGLVASGERAETTLESDKLLYAKHLQPTLGRLRVEKMTSAHVSKLLSDSPQERAGAGQHHEDLQRPALDPEPGADSERDPRRPGQGRAAVSDDPADPEPVPDRRAGLRPSVLLAPERRRS